MGPISPLQNPLESPVQPWLMLPPSGLFGPARLLLQ
jgi:hypothetical protein